MSDVDQERAARVPLDVLNPIALIVPVAIVGVAVLVLSRRRAGTPAQKASAAAGRAAGTMAGRAAGTMAGRAARRARHRGRNTTRRVILTVVINALTGIQPASGEMVIVKPGTGGEPEVVGRLKVD